MSKSSGNILQWGKRNKHLGEKLELGWKVARAAFSPFLSTVFVSQLFPIEKIKYARL
jgi:hypothetical protein